MRQDGQLICYGTAYGKTERERERERVQCAVLCGAVRCCVERGDREVISE